MGVISIIAAVRDFRQNNEVIANTGKVRNAEVLIAGGSCPSAQRNAAVKKAKGEIIYFIDDDSVINSPSVKKAVKILKGRNNKTAVAGGPAITPSSDSLMQRVFGETLSSFWASGKSGARYAEKGVPRFTTEKEIILCNMFIKRNVFLELGGFNEGLYPNEENEFLNRLNKAGYLIRYDPGITVKRSARKNFARFANQCFNYGRGRAEQTRAGFSAADAVNFVPSVFIVYLLSMGMFAAGPVYMAPLIVYLNITGIFSAAAAWKLKSVLSFPLFLVAFPVLHVSYGAGMIYGFIKGLFFKKQKFRGKIKVVRKKI